MFIVLIAGSRDAGSEHVEIAEEIVNLCNQEGHYIVVGDAPGVDEAVMRACARTKTPCFAAAPRGHKHRNFDANARAMFFNTGKDYSERDQRMVEMATHCFFIWNGESKGTKAGYDYALRLRKPARLFTVQRQLSLF